MSRRPSNISSQIIAIRRLVVDGLDVQAKQLLRALVEQLDVALLVSVSSEALLDFEKTLDGASANDFWHKHLSKGRLRASAHSKLRERLGDDCYRDLEVYFKQEDKILGMAIHPSLGASQMVTCASIIGVDSDRPFTFGFAGHVSPFSERTLAYATFYMLFYMVDGYVPEIDLEENKDGQERNILRELRDRVYKGRVALANMICHSFINKDSLDLSTRISYDLFSE